jgi:hypothetical protein
MMCAQRANLGFKFCFGCLHAAIAHGFVAAGVGLDLGAINSDGAQFDQSHFARQAHDLDKQFGELAQVQGSELPYRAVDREVVGREYPKGDIFMQFPGNLA